MRVIILKDTPKVGKKDEVKEVPDGHALNFLIPRGIAERATPQALKNLEERKDKIRVEKEIDEKLLQKNFDELKKVTLTLTEKANDKGSLFSGITKDRIKDELESKERVNLDKDMIVLPHPIKEVGSHKIEVSYKSKKASFILVVNGK